MEFENIRPRIEKIFEIYRKHKYYTLFMSDYDTSITSHIDEIGGGKSNLTSDKTADTAIKNADDKLAAKNFVKLIEKAIDQLPEVEKKVIQMRYMTRDFKYISDYTIYEVRLPMSDKTFKKVRDRAFEKLYIMLVLNKYD